MSISFSPRAGALILMCGVLLGSAVVGIASAQTPWVAPEAEKVRKNPLANDNKAIEQERTSPRPTACPVMAPRARATALRRWR